MSVSTNVNTAHSHIKNIVRKLDWLGDALVKNPPANTEDTGSIPGPGRSHMPWGTEPVHHTYWAQCLEAVLHLKSSRCSAKPVRGS